MPTIQLKLSDAEYEYLLDVTGESTGIKAARYCITEYAELKSSAQAEFQARQSLKREYESLQDKVLIFSRLLQYFQQFDQ